MILFLLLNFALAQTYQIIHKKGVVTIEREGKVIPGTEVKVGDQVRVEKDGLAILRAPGETIKLLSDTTIQVSEISQSSTLRLFVGGVISKIDKKGFAIKTKSTSMGVRGTQFFASVDEKDVAWMCVNEGIVDVGGVAVPAGKGVFVKDGSTSKPRAFAWTKQINWNMDEKNGELESEVKIEANYSDLLEHAYD